MDLSVDQKLNPVTADVDFMASQRNSNMAAKDDVFWSDKQQHVIDLLSNNDSLTLTVAGTCMHPELLDRQRVTVRTGGWYIPGDIVAYYCPYKCGFFIHRLLGAVPNLSGRWKYVLIPDNSHLADIIVDRKNIIGRVIRRSDSPYTAAFTTRLACFIQLIAWGLQVTRRKLARHNH